MTASFGVTDTTMGRYLADLLRLADGALQTAKAQGRNRVRTAVLVSASG